MEKLIFFGILLCCSFLSLKAQDVILMKDNSTITSVVKEVGEDYIIYKAFDNQTGPDYRVALSKIQSIRYANGKEDIFSNISESQEVNYDGTLTKSGDRLKYNGKKLSDIEVESIIGSTVYKETYVGARKQLKAANTLLITGAVCAAAGVVGIILWANSDLGDGAYIGGYAAATLGGACLDGCIALSIIGSSRMKWIANDYNEKAAKSRAELNFGLQRHGVGLALNF